MVTSRIGALRIHSNLWSCWLPIFRNLVTKKQSCKLMQWSNKYCLVNNQDFFQCFKSRGIEPNTIYRIRLTEPLMVHQFYFVKPHFFLGQFLQNNQLILSIATLLQKVLLRMLEHLVSGSLQINYFDIMFIVERSAQIFNIFVSYLWVKNIFSICVLGSLFSYQREIF